MLIGMVGIIPGRLVISSRISCRSLISWLSVLLLATVCEVDGPAPGDEVDGPGDNVDGPGNDVDGPGDGLDDASRT